MVPLHRAANSGACTNGVGLPIAYIERLILSAIQGLLLDPELEADFNREYHHAVAAHNQAAEREAANSESRLRELDRANQQGARHPSG